MIRTPRKEFKMLKLWMGESRAIGGAIGVYAVYRTEWSTSRPAVSQGLQRGE